METIIFATNNQHKADEIKPLVNDLFQIISLKEAGITIDIAEPHNTLEENASEKCRTIFKLTGQNCFSEDTGLEVEALHGAPGVRSARYAGDEHNDEKNIDKLLAELTNISNRKARFRTIISLILNGTEKQFEGICEGTILHQRKGNKGFGYDAVFVPAEDTRSFGEMDLHDKIKYSHRAKATAQLLAFLSLTGKK